MHKIMEEFAWKFYSRWFDLTWNTQSRDRKDVII